MVEKGPGDEHDREDGHEPDEDHGDDHPERSPRWLIPRPHAT
jgi:hypothetical protein